MLAITASNRLCDIERHLKCYMALQLGKQETYSNFIEKKTQTVAHPTNIVFRYLIKQDISARNWSFTSKKVAKLVR